MTPKQFKNLKVGDKVVLIEPRLEYGCGYPVPGGRAAVSAGSVGVVGAVNVPAVRGAERNFACIDFPPDVKLIHPYNGEILVVENPHNNTYRVAAFAAEIELA